MHFSGFLEQLPASLKLTRSTEHSVTSSYTVRPVRTDHRIAQWIQNNKPTSAKREPQ